MRCDLDHDDQGQDDHRNVRKQVLDVGKDVSLLLEAKTVVENKRAKRQGHGDIWVRRRGIAAMPDKTFWKWNQSDQVADKDVDEEGRDDRQELQP